MKEQWLKTVLRWKGVLERYKYVLLVMAVGVVLLLLPTGSSPGETRQAAQAAEETVFDLEEFEEKLEQALSQIQGAGAVRVVLTLEDSGRQVLAQDQDQTAQGELSLSTVTVGRGSGNQEVVPLQQLTPAFRGALVVCPGGDSPQVQLKLTQAVAALTGLGSDKISVCGGEP